MLTTLILVGALALTTAPSTRPATTQAASRPATQSLRRITTIEAVEQRFIERVGKLRKTSDEEMKAAREDRQRGLEQVVNQALDKRDADLVIRARELMKSDAPATRPAVVAKAPIDSADELRAFLTGTRWTWGNERLQFAGDGTVTHQGWTGQGLVTRWRAIDRRTVLFSIARGRNTDRTAVLMFNEALDGYDIVGFGGESYGTNRRLE